MCMCDVMLHQARELVIMPLTSPSLNWTLSFYTHKNKIHFSMLYTSCSATGWHVMVRQG